MAPITRILAFKFSDEATPEKRQEIHTFYKNLLRDHSGATLGPRNGTNRTPPPLDIGFDIVMLIEFPDRETATRYDDHPEHIAYKKLAGPFMTNAFMYEFDLNEARGFELEPKRTASL